MSASHLSPGFHGKLPSTGDFVSRGLPAEFVRNWDRWVARHAAPLLAEDLWQPGRALRFLLGPSALGPRAGVVLPSADRVGRRFPLTIAVELERATTGCAAADGWFRDVAAAALAAQEGRGSADELAAELALLPFPAAAPGEAMDGMLIWADRTEPAAIDFHAPRAELERLLTVTAEAH